MHGEGSFAEGRINNLDYGFRETAPTVGVPGRDCGQGFLDLLNIAFIWPGFVFCVVKGEGHSAVPAGGDRLTALIGKT